MREHLGMIQRGRDAAGGRRKCREEKKQEGKMENTAYIFWRDLEGMERGTF